MDHREVGRMWNANAAAWTELVRAGFDIYRDYLNSPAFFQMLPLFLDVIPWLETHRQRVFVMG